MSFNSNIKVVDISYAEHMDSQTIEQVDNTCSKQDSQAGFQQDSQTGSQVNTANIVHQIQANDEIKLFNLQNSNQYNQANIYVYIEKTNTQNLGRLHPMVVGDILHNKLKLKSCISSIEKNGLNRVKVKVKTLHHANQLISSPLLKGENLKAFIPNNLLYRKGLIRDVDPIFDDIYLKNNIESTLTITGLDRFKRKVVEGEKLN